MIFLPQRRKGAKFSQQMQPLSRRRFFSFTEKKPEPTGFWLHVSRTAMACRFEVTLPIGDRAGVEVATNALNLIDELEAQLSVFKETSEVTHAEQWQPHRSDR